MLVGGLMKVAVLSATAVIVLCGIMTALSDTHLTTRDESQSSSLEMMRYSLGRHLSQAAGPASPENMSGAEDVGSIEMDDSNDDGEAHNITTIFIIMGSGLAAILALSVGCWCYRYRSLDQSHRVRC